MSLRPLLPVELEALSLFANGKATEEIGELLRLHKSAVQDHLRVAARKLGALNRTHAAVIASELGLVTAGRKSRPGQPDAAEERRRELIRERAYHLWLAEGRPEGCEAEHWTVAEAEIDAEAQALQPGEREPLPNPFDPREKK